MTIIIIIFLLILIGVALQYEIRLKSLKQSEKKIEEKEIDNEFFHINFRFLENICHELRTPLNGIIGSIDLFRHGESYASNEVNLDILENSSNNLLSLVNQIIAVSQLHLHDNKNEKIETNLSEFIFDLREIFYAKASKSVEVSFFVSTGLPEQIQIDNIKLKQVLFELLTNAFKYTSLGEINLCVRLGQNKEKQDMLEISVKDTGTGIMEKNLTKIFDTFSKNMSMRSDYSGIGLGLTSVKKLVEFLSGFITVKSKYGVGTEFILKIPYSVNKTNIKVNNHTKNLNKKIILFMPYNSKNYFIQEMLSEQELEFEVFDDIEDLKEVEFSDDIIFIVDIEQETLLELKKLIGNNRKKLIIFSDKEKVVFNITEAKYISRLFRQEELLEAIFDEKDEEIENGFNNFKNYNNFKVAVIEDNKYNLEIIKQMLDIVKANASYFESGEDFLRTLKDTKFDLIFLDIQLPDMTGFDVLNIIRKQEIDSGVDERVFVTALTAHSFDGYKEKCLDAGFDSYLTKPFRMNDLINEIQKVGITINNCTETFPAADIDIVSKSEDLKIILLEVYDNDFILMRDAFLKKDYKNIKYFSHKLKGSFSIAGEKELAKIFSEIEKTPEIFNVKIIKEIENKIKPIREKTYREI